MQGLLDKNKINKRKKGIKRILFFVFVVLIFYMGVSGLVGGVFNFIGKPVWFLKNQATSFFENIGYFFDTKNYLYNENERLSKENNVLRLEMINYQILEEENNELKSILNNLPKNKEFILSNILSKPNISPYDKIIIDIGSINGVFDGDNIYAEGLIPIGTVEKVYGNTSLVSLYSNPGRKTEGFLTNSNATVTLVGRGGGNFEMVVPIELEIEKGSIVYLPGNNLISVAIVREITSRETDPFKKIILNSPVNVQDLKWVEVEKK